MCRLEGIEAEKLTLERDEGGELSGSASVDKRGEREMSSVKEGLKDHI